MVDEIKDEGMEDLLEKEVEQEEVVDELQPGAKEGLPKKDEPPADSPRWNKVYKRMKDAERNTDELKQKLVERDRDVQGMRTHLDNLSEAIASSKEEKSDVVDTKEIDSNLSGMQDTIAKIKTDLRSARKELEWDKVDSLEDKLEEAHYRVNRLISEKNKMVSQKVEKKDDKTSKKEDTVKSTISTFKKDTPWFNPKNEEYNPIMRAAAMDIDDELAEDPDWKDKPLEERLSEVKKQVEKKMNYKPSNKGKPPSLESNDLSGLRGGDTPSDSKLSDEEKSVARFMFPDKPPNEAEKMYAGQKKFIASRKQGRA